ncbi:MAG TPA: linear amide C-N hydrolase [Pyrinomonadaceae bacterium]
MVKISPRLLPTFFALACLLGRPAAAPRACSTFALRHGARVVYGNNYDWSNGNGLVLVNKRGVSKSALPAPGEPDAPRWVSKYGSVTFNQYGRELPASGMNEAGLVVMLMWLDETTYPAADGRGAVNPLEWIQYQLDNFGGVGEVLRAAPSLRVSSSIAKVHYLVGDREGAAAAVEFLGGRLVVHAGPRLPVAALTNDTYARSLLSLKKYAGFGGALPLPSGTGSLERFARAAAFAKDYRPAGDAGMVEDAFGLLAGIAQGDYTKWGIVYDPRAPGVYFRTLKSPEVKRLDARSLDFRCATPAKLLDVNQPAGGDVLGRLGDYDPARNESLVRASFGAAAMLKGVPESYLSLVARHPQAQACRE